LVDCDDTNSCTDDSCDPASGCVNDFNTSGCDDGDACTTDDTCSDGMCVGGPLVDCDDTNSCTDDSCDPASGCVNDFNTSGCDDGDACTTDDTCSDGVCVGGPPLDCSDANPCTDDSCDTALGCQYAPLSDGTPCADEFFCNGDETCQSGVCTDGPDPCNEYELCEEEGHECFPAPERSHPGWNSEGFKLALTGNQPTYWSAHSGHPGPDAAAGRWTMLDAAPSGHLPGRPDPEGSDERVLRGYVVAWAVLPTGEEIRWNHLKGDAVIVNYDKATAWEYNAVAYQALDGENGLETNNGLDPGVLSLNGVEYDQSFEVLLLDFYATGMTGFSGIHTLALDTDLTLLPVSVDLRQDNGHGLPPVPVTTKARFDIWNQEESGPFGYERCITCWDQALLSSYEPAGLTIFMREFLQTDKGVARIDGMESGVCPGSEANPLVGVAAKHLTFGGFDRLPVGRDTAGMNLPGWGYDDSAVVRADVTPGGGGTGERPGAGQSGSLSEPVRASSLVSSATTDSGGFGSPEALVVGQNVRASSSEKGSLLIFPKVELRWNSAGELLQDTFIDLTNDHEDEVKVQVYYVQGDPPLTDG
ncbi:MAG: hypothetical protein GY842_08085, partial [bacterium]|nr:hypothetical protein [bacterium]